jgi:hypothetical protein
MRARAAACFAVVRPSRSRTAAIASSVRTVRISASRWWGSVGFGGVAEDDLAHVGPPVVDLLAVALHHRADDRHHRVERVGDALGRRSTPPSTSPWTRWSPVGRSSR